jgi:hypothetical protein
VVIHGGSGRKPISIFKDLDRIAFHCHYLGRYGSSKAVFQEFRREGP